MSSINSLPKFIANKLYSYQINHSIRLINIINDKRACLDASDTGTGKTYAAIAVCKYLKLNAIIICPKSVIATWKEVSKHFNYNPLMIVNYETIRTGKYYINGEREKCPYIEQKYDSEKEINMYRWKVPDNTIFIFDEAHRCRHIGTYNSLILLSAKDTKRPIMVLSATIADSPDNFKIFTYILNFLDPQQVREEKIKFMAYMRTMTHWIERVNNPMNKIYHMLYPDRASRIRIDDLGDMFPETQIIAQAYSVDKKVSNQIEKEYQNIAMELDDLENKRKKDKINPLVATMRFHQKIELLKIPIFVDIAKDFLDSGYSVVIFCNFTATLKTLKELLKSTCTIHGQQTEEERTKNIKDFQKNKKKLIICNIKAGGVGISLHDINGNHPRISLINPTWSSTAMVQALGRVHRAGGKSKSLQRIVYTANTVEEKIADKVKLKLKDLNKINNGDLDLTRIKFIRDKKKFILG